MHKKQLTRVIIGLTIKVAILELFRYSAEKALREWSEQTLTKREA